jgi:DNA-directed RNA polymerase specialized sigma24 family protein
VPSADAADCVEQRAEMRQLVEEIARLPERQRMALVMREFDGCSHVETAQRLHTTVPATKSLIIRARSNLHAAVSAA